MRIHHTSVPVPRDVPAAGTARFHAWATELGVLIDRGGTHSVDGHLRALAQRARELQVAAVSTSVLADRRAADVVRARAFSRVVAAIGALTPATTVRLDATA
jgi:hypothetical protein